MTFFQKLGHDFKRNKMLYLISFPVVAFLIIFSYIPMGGLVMAFEKFSPKGGIFSSPWVGFDNFKHFFQSVYFLRVLGNTFLLSFYDLIFGFWAPIIFALLLNEIKDGLFKKTIQTISYLPYFVSMVVICGLIMDFTGGDGFISRAALIFGSKDASLLSNPANFRSIFVVSNIWQGLGYGSIIYLAALSSVDQELFEAARMDGAGRLRQIWHITLPGISSTIVIMLILRIGLLLTVNFEKVLLLYSPATYETADVISTYVYRKGILGLDYGYSTAVGLFNSVIAFILVAGSNALAKRYSDVSLY
ncbi:MAG TPA: ABC transporter permease subunit [Clostridia bacterium]|nr:ABC transporter permease subunit [Clostridia bacterium]